MCLREAYYGVFYVNPLPRPGFGNELDDEKPINALILPATMLRVEGR